MATPITRDLPPLSLRAAVEPASLDVEKRTATVTWTTGSRVLRAPFWGEKFYEELSLDPKHVRMGRLESGRAPLLDAHDLGDTAAVVGVVESARLERGRGTAVVRFAKDDARADAVWNKVKQGVLSNLSVGYRTYRMEKIEDGAEQLPVFRAVDWEPHEVSVVALGADAGAAIRSAEARATNPCEFITQPTEERTIMPEKSEVTASAEVLAERTRASSIRDLAKRYRLGAEFADDLVSRGTPLAEARGLILDALATRDEQTEIQAHVAYGAGDDSQRVGEATRRIGLMAEALAARLGGPKATDAAAGQFTHMKLRDMARDLLELRGVSTRLLSDSKIITRAGFHTTGDFPNLLTGTGNRILRAAYESAPPGIRRIARESSAPDFRAKSLLMLGQAPALERVNEAGEFKRGTMAEAKESYSLATFGKIFAITRQALVNDDMGAFGDMTVRLGRAAAEFVAVQLRDLLYGAAGVGPTMSDGNALFHSAHANIGTGGVISDTTLTEAFRLMRLQKGLDGVTPVNATPRFLVVPAAIEVAARKAVAAINAAQTSAVNVFAGALEVVVDPRLDAKSSTRWWLSADPALFDTLEYSYLEGDPGPTFDTRFGFDIDGVESKVRLDFGAGAIDWRGLLTNAGA